MATAIRAVPVLAPTPALADDGDSDTSLAELMREVGHALDADRLVVSWHEGGGQAPVLLFTDGVDADGGLAGQTFFPGELSFGPFDTQPRSEWHQTSPHAPGGELTTCIPTTGGVVSITGRFDKLGVSTLARARAAVGRLLPVVRPFVRLWAVRRAMMSRMRGLTAAVNKSDVGIVLVNRFGQTLFVNATAERLLAEQDGIRSQGRNLSGARSADTLRLQTAIELAISAGEDPAHARSGPVVALSRKSGRPLLALAVASGAAPGQTQESAAIVYLCDPDQDLTPLIESACKLYALSPVETKLTCRLATGVSLLEAAESLNIREQTARSYLKQVFLKTETKRQAELVWLMLKSAVRTSVEPFEQQV